MMRRWRNPFVVFLHDLAAVPIAWMGAYWVRFNLDVIPALFLEQALVALPLLILVQGGVFWYFGLYRGVWRFASIPDLIRIAKGVLVGVVLTTIILFMLNRLESIPRSVPLLYAVFLLLLLGGARFAYRGYKDRRLYSSDTRNVLIVGAGRAGEILVRDLLRQPELGYSPVVFVDDNIRKKGKEIHGVRVAGRLDSIPSLVKTHRVELILIALPGGSSRQVRRVVELCERAGVPFRILPRTKDLVSGKVSIQELREVAIEDLLGRDPIQLSWEAVTEHVAGKCVLVTGGGGSIGSELCRQLARLDPRSLVIVENGEHHLYKVEQELRGSFPDLPLHAHLVDVCDRTALEWVFAHRRPHLVFHAAAYKHVPMLEGQVREAIRNNVLGTVTAAQMADSHGCEAFILISTDKAVNPTNVMGASKRIAEIFCQNLNVRSATRFVTVRFGNVLGSAGSVVPLFHEQIAKGGPVTVTHPEITRYFMTIPEACQLIIEAGSVGCGGEIFVLDMGDPIKIHYLAEQMIRLSGKIPGEDIEIVYTGLRPGEKLFEELFHEQENLRATSQEKLLLANPRYLEWDWLWDRVMWLRSACESYDEDRLLGLILDLVPELDRPVNIPGHHVSMVVPEE
ncbi:UDP-N-acetyl-alpha-D-glucosamine C6 dehydratase [Thiorhodovibrio winogradskyi]|uniref:UDP-N-acetyl-alpha-D-glucosamine C6 dehydratase n=1 Tax=Thiorhodovibrio winogradskyi TaxID=77007 RepID=A0ABZ0S9B8_9GAMM|nr:nucleoside-diphosphate sugar epimerase/dehydratase [Thiorhodovibrio winogradskyi]